MSNQNQVTGEWISEQIKIAKSTFQKDRDKNNNIFTYNPNSKLLNDRIAYLRTICPHEYDKKAKVCIYCGKSINDKNHL